MSYFSAGRSYLAGGPANSVTRTVFDGIATAGQTVISPPGGVAAGMNDVYVGGACLSQGDYNDSNGTSIILAKSMALGTQYRVVAYGKLGDVTLNPNLYVLKSGDTMTGNLTFSGNGQRIFGDMANALASNRLLFQNSTANNPTVVGAIPSGTGTQANFNVYASSDPDNATVGQLLAFPGDVRVGATYLGTGAPSSLSFYTGGVSRYSITAAGQHWFAGSNIISAIPLVLTAAVATSGAAIQFSPGSSLRYFLGWDSNNFTLNRYNASGTYQNTPFYVRDTDGAVVYGTAIVAGVVQASSVNTNGLTVASGITCTGNSIELGPVAAGPAYIDMHCSGNAVDYDARIIATGGNATVGNGLLDIYTQMLSIRPLNGYTDFYSTTGIAALRVRAGSYIPVFRANSGNSSFEWVNSANTAVNLTLNDVGVLTPRSTIVANGGIQCPSTLWMLGANSIRLDGGGYSGFLRGDTSGLVGFINQAQNNWTMQIKDSGQIWCSNQWQWGDVSNLGGQFNGSGSVGGHTERNAIIQCSDNVNMYLGHTGAGGTLAWFGVAGNGVGTISCSATNTSYNTSSDYRLKKNVETLTGGLDRVMQMRPVAFDWILNGESSRGFIAHELADVEPNAVTGTKDAMTKALGDPDGPDIPDYQQVDSSFCIPDMVVAIQELKAALDAALGRIATLEGAA